VWWLAIYLSGSPLNIIGIGVLVAIAAVFVVLAVYRSGLKTKSQLAALDYWAKFRGDISCLNASDRREKFWS
jgi:hypothetical protein